MWNNTRMAFLYLAYLFAANFTIYYIRLDLILGCIVGFVAINILLVVSKYLEK